MPESTSVLQAKSRLGTASRWGTPGEVEDARRDLAAAKIEQYVASVVADAPPLTDAQRDRLAGIIRASREARAK